MLETFLVAALLSVTDPAGDVGSNLAAPTATVFRQESVFDLRSVTVHRTPALSFSVEVGKVSPGFPEVLLELYLSSSTPDGVQATELLPGSALRLAEGASWLYAFQIVGERVQVFEARASTQIKAQTDITEASGAALSASGDTLTVTTTLPVPERLGVYAVSGSYDPFSKTGWRTLRTKPSPWGFSGTATSPVLDILADTPAVQTLALAQGVLPEVRASVSEPGWLALAGAGVLLSFAGLAVRLSLGRQNETLPPAPHLAPFSTQEVQRRVRLLRAFEQGQGKLVSVGEDLVTEESARPPKPVMS